VIERSLRALDGMCLNLKFCITGDSDSGKSVLLRLALGFLRPIDVDDP
jgi:hypothetical protein